MTAVAAFIEVVLLVAGVGEFVSESVEVSSAAAAAASTDTTISMAVVVFVFGSVAVVVADRTGSTSGIIITIQSKVTHFLFMIM